MTQVDTKIQQAQQENADSIQEQTKALKHEVKEEVNRQVSEFKQGVKNQSLKDKAYDNRFNLVVVGLQESEEKSDIELVNDHFSNALKIKNVKVRTAYRLGAQPETESSYVRPIMGRFNNLAQRNRIWRERMDITNDDGSKIRIQADLPKELREGMPLMYKTLRAALKMKGFENAKI